MLYWRFQREILAQMKDLRAKEYFVYFEPGNPHSWGKRSAEGLLCPAVGALNSLVPAGDALVSLLGLDVGLEGPVDGPVLDDVLLALPVAHSQTGR